MSFGQNEDLHIVSPAGSTYHANELTLDWTIGEVVITSMQTSSMGVSQGFHQPNISVVSVQPIPEELGTVAVFPNPFSNDLDINIQYSIPQKGVLKLFDFTGKIIWKQPFEGIDIVERLSTTSFPAGTYLFVVSIGETPFVYTYQLVKM